MEPTPIRLYFSTGSEWSHYRLHFVRIGQWLRSAPRHPLTWFRHARSHARVASTAGGVLLFVRVVRLLSGSRIVHVAVGDQDVVASPSFNGVEFFPRIRFEQKYPGLLGWFTVPTPRARSLDRWCPCRSTHFGHVLAGSAGRAAMLIAPPIRRLLPPRIANDCLGVALWHLADADITVPRRARRTPAALHRWLEEQGYEWTSAPSADGRRAAEGARPRDPAGHAED